VNALSQSVHIHEPCAPFFFTGTEGGGAFHIFWYCPAAQRVWSRLRTFWESLGLWASTISQHDGSFPHAVFALDLPRTPSGVWNLLPSHTSALVDVSTVHEALQQMWTLQVLDVLQVIWRWRHSHHDGAMWAPTKADGLAAAAVHAAVSRISRATDAATGRTAASTVLAALAAVPPSTSPPEPVATHPPPQPIDTFSSLTGAHEAIPGPGEPVPSSFELIL
jgi:hypothetical protein